MYLSHLMINVGSNPDRPRPGRLWLRNVYHVHQRLSMAFPTPVQCATDPQFLRPFDPAGFQHARFLFRIDHSIEQECPRVLILVQSHTEPDWEYAFQNARMFRAAEPETREYNPSFQVGEKYRFRIRINPTRKSKSERSKDGTVLLRKRCEGTDKHGRPKDQGKRLAFTWDKHQGPDAAICEWFAAKSSRCGFSLGAFQLSHLGWITAWKPKTGVRSHDSEGPRSERQMKFRSALIEGTLEVSEATAFAQTIASGIGPAKGFGFGLMSVLPL
jgi:CRISPR system Cascade subunit CasE